MNDYSSLPQFDDYRDRRDAVSEIRRAESASASAVLSQVARGVAAIVLVFAVGCTTLFGVELYATLVDRTLYEPVTRLPWTAAGAAMSVAALAVVGCMFGGDE